MMRKILMLALAFAVGTTARTAAQETEFTTLFDGSTFEGWEGSKEFFRIEDGAIVAGTLDASIPHNAFLCTTREYVDFELRFETRLQGPGDNSGVQFRSRRVPGHHEVSGYQADIGTVSRDWFDQVTGEQSGGAESMAPVWGAIYDEHRRDRYLAWGSPEDVDDVLKPDDWNEMVVRAVGPRIQIWVNGYRTVDYTEKSHIPETGAVCVQIHSGQPAEAWFRDLAIRELHGGHTIVDFDKIVLTETFYAEGATFGDLNNDAHNDVVAGPFWYEGPDFDEQHAYYEPSGFEPEQYSDNFFAHVYDFDDDGWNDVFIIGFPGEQAIWFENPGAESGHWTPHEVFDGVDNESPAWTDITGDGRPEMVFIHEGRYGYAEPDWDDPTRPWTFNPVTPDGGWQKFTHGLGVGDVNGDGRKDLLEKDAWWEQPSSLEGDPVWTRHEADFGQPGGAQILVYDVDDDGDNDVISSLAAHGYGLAWYEHVRRDGEIRFIRHMIMNENPEENPYGVAFAELHALDLVDVDGDDVKDVVTGKRWWSHGAEGDPDPNPRPYLYWFRIARSGDEIEFVPHLIDDDVGVGVQVVTGDIDGDGYPDVVVANKRATVVLLQERRQVTEAEWQRSVPKAIYRSGSE